MVSLSNLVQRAAAASFIVACAAHPGEHHDHAAIERAIAQRDANAQLAQNSLSKCSGSAEQQALARRSISRRAEHLQRLRKDRGISTNPQKYRRDLATLEEFEEGQFSRTDNCYLPSS